MDELIISNLLCDLIYSIAAKQPPAYRKTNILPLKPLRGGCPYFCVLKGAPTDSPGDSVAMQKETNRKKKQQERIADEFGLKRVIV
ncbi:MAG: hypothetical protein LAP13_07300 [Acidobacteriia bacterium]|nr:hypothetical protein [Terriglobia bacterium]